MQDAITFVVASRGRCVIFSTPTTSALSRKPPAIALYASSTAVEPAAVVFSILVASQGKRPSYSATIGPVFSIVHNWPDAAFPT